MHCGMQGLIILLLPFFLLISLVKATMLNPNYLVTFPNKVSYGQAHMVCDSEGLNLVKIDDDTSNEMVYNFAVTYGLGTYWIEGSDRKLESNWVDFMGKPLLYKKFDSMDPIHKACIIGNFFKNSFWSDAACGSSHGIICYGEPTVHFTENELVIIPGQLNYRQATDECKDRGFNLVKIQSADINQLVYNFAVKNKLGRYWIDGTDIDNENRWAYNDGKSIVYSNFYTNEPNNLNNEDCLQGYFFSNPFWNDFPCDLTNSVICFTGRVRQSRMVAFPNRVTYDESIKVCKSEGMLMYRVRSDTANEMVYNFAKSINLGTYWLDGTDKTVEGKWVYNDGRDMTYNKWYTNEPSNLGNEDCVQGAFFENSDWNDVSCYSQSGIICYGDPVISYTENNLIRLPGQVNYQDAVNLCKDNGYNLVKIQNEAVNQIVFSFAVKNQIGRYWIEGSDKDDEGKWIYNDGNRMVYSKYPGWEPNNKGDEDCIHGLYYQSGFWNDISCNSLNSVICYAGSIRN